MLDRGGNLVPKVYHQRQDDFEAFQIYNAKQHNFTRYTLLGAKFRAWISYKIINYIILHDVGIKLDLA